MPRSALQLTNTRRQAKTRNRANKQHNQRIPQKTKRSYLKYQVYAIKTKGDNIGKLALVYDGQTACNLHQLKERLIFNSIEYDETVKLIPRTKEANY